MNSLMSQFSTLAKTFKSYDQMVERDAAMKQNRSHSQFHPHETTTILEMSWTGFFFFKIVLCTFYIKQEES
jgi:hypothetical protein